MQYVSILRGINVGGKRKVLMLDLKKIYSDLGFANVRTYIQSGNVIFESTAIGNEKAISKSIEEAIVKHYGFEVPVITITSTTLNSIFENNPYIKEAAFDIDRLHLTFLATTPEQEAIESAQSFNFEPDSFQLIASSAYLFCAGKYHESKLGNTWFENKLKVTATTRNWKTVKKLQEIASIELE